VSIHEEVWAERYPSHQEVYAERYQHNPDDRPTCRKASGYATPCQGKVTCLGNDWYCALHLRKEIDRLHGDALMDENRRKAAAGEFGPQRLRRERDEYGDSLDRAYDIALHEFMTGGGRPHVR
jgi:hypothetical protein